jgi:hypothetical protein
MEDGCSRSECWSIDLGISKFVRDQPAAGYREHYGDELTQNYFHLDVLISEKWFETRNREWLSKSRPVFTNPPYSCRVTA